MLTKLFILLPFIALAEGVVIEFGEVISTCLTREQLWAELDQSLIDSKDSSLWPNQLSTVEGSGLRPDGLIAVTYKTTVGDSTYEYELSEIEPLKAFRYSAVEGKHPFTGGARIELTEGNGVRLLSWQGEYRTPSSAWLERLFFRRYSENFFKQLSLNLNQVGDELCVKD